MATLVLTLHIIVCIFLIIIVLVQSSRENELSGLFTGGGGQPLFGPRSGNILTRITTILAITFMITSLTLTILSVRRPRRILNKVLTEEKVEETQPEKLIPVDPSSPEEKVATSEETPAGDLPR